MPLEIESPPATREEQYALTERKLRAQLYHPKQKPEKSAFKSPESYHQQKNIRGFEIEREIILHTEDKTNPQLTNRVTRSGSPRPKNAQARFEQEEKRQAVKACAQAPKQSNTPSRETKVDQVRSSIANYSWKSPVAQ